jgi:hypothetical protein
MKKFALTFLLLLSLGFVAQAGPEIASGKDMKQVVPAPCPEWYRDTEWNVSLWGTYVFTSEEWESDRYIEADHAVGGGMDLKYFFHRYFGVGVEAWAVEAQRERLDITGIGEPPDTIFRLSSDHSGKETRWVGALKGNFTFRYPFHCSRFAPYAYAGGGAIFGGGERDVLVFQALESTGVAQLAQSFHTEHRDEDVEFVGQVGAGFEYRVSPHVGLIHDFSWNFVSRDNSDFGMVRTGLNFAF